MGTTNKIVIAGAILGLSFAMVGESIAKTLRYAEFGPNRGTRAEALKWFAAELEKRSGGSLKVEFHWGKSLLGTKAVLKGVGDGVADMGSVIAFFDPKKLRTYNIGDLPVENSDSWVGMRALYTLATTNAAFQKQFAANKITYVSNYTTGPIQLICTKKISTLADLKGVKLRGSGPYGKTFGDLGATVQRMSQPKVYQALDSGLIQCNQNYYYSMKAYKQYEVAPHVAELNWGQNMGFGIIMNKKSYDSLSAKEQKIVTSVGSDFIDHLAEKMMKGLSVDKAAMSAGIDGKKITVTNLPSNERAQLLAAGKKYVKAWIDGANKDGLNGLEIMANYQSLIAKYDAVRKSKGYPWGR
jgi:TRAP-type C4-dicarboxylate transport system substrate-binding protein